MKKIKSRSYSVTVKISNDLIIHASDRLIVRQKRPSNRETTVSQSKKKKINKKKLKKIKS